MRGCVLAGACAQVWSAPARGLRAVRGLCVCGAVAGRRDEPGKTPMMMPPPPLLPWGRPQYVNVATGGARLHVCVCVVVALRTWWRHV